VPDIVEIERVSTITDDLRRLIEELDAELSQHYAPEQRHGISLEAIFGPNIRFFLARQNGSAMGCGGLALFPDFAEVKRMYVRKTMRGCGIADALMKNLIAEAAQNGLNTLRLETGIHSLAAIRFYARCGFAPCPAFEPYASMAPRAIETSYFMETRLTS
jgi:putative acetyltransferase